MARKLLTGYLLKDVSAVSDLEMVLSEMKQVVSTCANRAYERLVTWQTERIVDEISLNQYKRPENESILSIAEKEVQRRVLIAEQNMQRTEFNFYMGVQALIGKIDGNPAVYLKVNNLNDIYSKNLKKIPELIPYDITEDDLAAKKEKREFWESISMKYQDGVPVSCNLINYESITVDPEKLSFRAPAARAHDIATEKILNHLLSCYGCHQEISPNKLMEYTLQAMNRITYKDMQEAVALETDSLSQILPEITVELVTNTGMLPQKAIPTAVSEETEEKAEAS